MVARRHLILAWILLTYRVIAYGIKEEEVWKWDL